MEWTIKFTTYFFRLTKGMATELKKAFCQYIVQKKLGEGAYGKVYEVITTQSNQPLVVKNIPPEPDEGVVHPQELEILQKLTHPNLIHSDAILSALDCPMEGLAVVLPMATAVLKTLIPSTEYTYSQRVKNMFEMLSGLAFLHSQNYLHLDLKPDNVITRPGNVAQLIDYGIAMKVDQVNVPEPTDATRITTTYRPPENLRGARYKYYSGASDIWSMGIMFLEMLIGQDRLFFSAHPTLGWDERYIYEQIITKIKPGDFQPYLQMVPDLIRPYALDLLRQMLAIDPETRPTAVQCLDHPFFTAQNYTQPFLDGKVQPVNVPYRVPWNPRYQGAVEGLIAYCREFHPNMKARTLFLAVDILYRYLASISRLDNVDVTIGAVVMLASQYYYDVLGVFNVAEYAENANLTYFDTQLLYREQLAVLKQLNYILWRPYLYESVPTTEYLPVAATRLQSSEFYYQLNPTPVKPLEPRFEFTVHALYPDTTPPPLAEFPPLPDEPMNPPPPLSVWEGQPLPGMILSPPRTLQDPRSPYANPFIQRIGDSGGLRRSAPYEDLNTQLIQPGIFTGIGLPTGSYLAQPKPTRRPRFLTALLGNN